MAATSDTPVTVGYEITQGARFVDGALTGTVVLEAGDSFEQFRIPIDDDMVDEPDGLLQVTLQTNPAVTFGDRSASVRVTDNDQPPSVVSISGPSTVDESEGTATFTVTRLKLWTSTVYVDVDTSDGTATAGSDYTSVRTRVTFPAGAGEMSVDVPIRHDAIDEPREEFTVTLSNHRPAA